MSLQLDAPRRALAFLARHRWSFPLAALSTLCFAYLADEIRDGEVKAFDTTVALLVAESRGRWDGAMLLLTRVGGGLPMTVLAVAVVLGLALRRRRNEASFLAVSGLGTAFLSWGLKLAFARTRPESPFMIALPDSFSFPSGHAMGSAGVLASLVVVAHVVPLHRNARALVTAAALTLALGVGASRVYFGVHFPSDVLGGQLAAAAWVSAVTGWFYPRLLPGEEAVTATAGAQERPPGTRKDTGART